MATRVVTVHDVHDVLDGHVGLDLECFDRIYLNGWVPDKIGFWSYGVVGERRLDEFIADWLPGYQGNPVRIVTPPPSSSSWTSTARAWTRCTRPAHRTQARRPVVGAAGTADAVS